MRFPPEVYTQTEIESLIEAAGQCRDSYVGTRNQAILATLYRSGLRCAEVLDLEPHDVVSVNDGYALQVRNGKGGKHRIAGMDAWASQWLSAWLSVRDDVRGAHKAKLFFSPHSGRLAPSYVRKMMPKWRKLAGIAKRVHAHGMRHTLASELRKEGVDVGIISKQLGHAHISTTVRYLDHINPQEVIDAMVARR